MSTIVYAIETYGDKKGKKLRVLLLRNTKSTCMHTKINNFIETLSFIIVLLFYNHASIVPKNEEEGFHSSFVSGHYFHQFIDEKVDDLGVRCEA